VKVREPCRAVGVVPWSLGRLSWVYMPVLGVKRSCAHDDDGYGGELVQQREIDRVAVGVLVAERDQPDSRFVEPFGCERLHDVCELLRWHHEKRLPAREKLSPIKPHRARELRSRRDLREVQLLDGAVIAVAFQFVEAQVSG
jgi:hypothetical protein